MAPPVHRVEVYPPTVTIRYHHMSVETNALVGDKELPTLPHSVSHAFLSWTEPKRPLSIVHDASGILRPGRLTLILGPPSSGKTTFMKALVGRYRHSSDLKVRAAGEGENARVHGGRCGSLSGGSALPRLVSCSLSSPPGSQVTGSVTYNGKNFNEFMPERVASYVNQVCGSALLGMGYVYFPAAFIRGTASQTIVLAGWVPGLEGSGPVLYESGGSKLQSSCHFTPQPRSSTPTLGS